MMARRSVFGTITVSILGLLLLGGCVGDVELAPTKLEDDPAVTAPAGFDEESGDALVGQTVVGGGFAMRLISFQLIDTIPGVPTAVSGRQYLLVEVELKRRGDGDADFHEGNFLVQHPDETRPNDYARVELPDNMAFGFGTLAKGERKHGYVAFNVADGRQDFILSYVAGRDVERMRWWLTGLIPTPPEVVPAVLCTVTPDRRDVGVLGNAPLMSYPTPASSNGSISSGAPAYSMIAPEDINAVALAVETAIACINAGDPERLASIVTSDFLRRFPAVRAALSGPAPVPARALTIVSVEAMTVRFYSSSSAVGNWAQASVNIADPDRPGETIQALFTFRQDGELNPWRIDNVDGDRWFVEAFGRADATPAIS